MAKRKLFKIDTDAYEKAHLAGIEKYASKVDYIYRWAASEYAKIAASVNNFNPGKDFSFSDYPQTNARVNALLKEVYSKIHLVIQTGTADKWAESNKKNDDLVDLVFENSKVPKKDLEIYYDHTESALIALQKLKTDGMTLSDRVWKYNDQFKEEIELMLDQGLRDGKSAADLSRIVRQHLKEPEKLFRRVRNNDGKLVLSKAAQAYNPGTGVYRSAYKNSMRLTRTVINSSYREADHTRWQKLDFVVGYEVKLSNNPNHCPVCAALAGKYPKWFKFVGWHPQCRCYIISILKTDEEIDADDIRILQGKEPLPGSVNEVNNVPPGFSNYIVNNKDRFANAKKQPYWVRDNFKSGDVTKGMKGPTVKIQQPAAEKNGVIDLGKIIKGKVATDDEIRQVLFEVDRLKPEYFRNGLDAVKVVSSPKYMMMHSMSYNNLTKEWVGGSTLSISAHKFQSIQFNAAEEFRGALAAIKSGSELTFNQEYSIESMWHEILHARTLSKPRKLTTKQIESMETLNQFTARHTYNEFIELLGGKAIHQAAILDNGYGYNSWVTAFRSRLLRFGIDEKQAASDLFPILMGDYNKIEFELLKYFAKFQK